jgi:hypothetical protein
MKIMVSAAKFDDEQNNNNNNCLNFTYFPHSLDYEAANTYYHNIAAAYFNVLYTEWQGRDYCTK